MARIVPISLIESIHGKLDKDENFVFSKRYGNTHVWEVEPSTKEPTANQLAQQMRFATAASQHCLPIIFKELEVICVSFKPSC